MKNANVRFFVIKMIILLITVAIMVALYFMLGFVLDTVGIKVAVGESAAEMIKCGLAFAAFLIYSIIRARKFKNLGEDAAWIFALNESSVLIAFLLPLLVVSLIVGFSQIPQWLYWIYSPFVFMYIASSGNPAVGFGVPVILFFASMIAVSIAAGPVKGNGKKSEDGTVNATAEDKADQ